MLEQVRKPTYAATEVILLEEVCEKAVLAEGVAALESDWLHEHLEADGAGELPS